MYSNNAINSLYYSVYSEYIQVSFLHIPMHTQAPCQITKNYGKKGHNNNFEIEISLKEGGKWGWKNLFSTLEYSLLSTTFP